MQTTPKTTLIVKGLKWETQERMSYPTVVVILVTFLKVSNWKFLHLKVRLHLKVVAFLRDKLYMARANRKKSQMHSTKIFFA